MRRVYGRTRRVTTAGVVRVTNRGTRERRDNPTPRVNPRQEYKLIIVGLDNAGKTTTLYKLHLGVSEGFASGCQDGLHGPFRLSSPGAFVHTPYEGCHSRGVSDWLRKRVGLVF